MKKILKALLLVLIILVIGAYVFVRYPLDYIDEIKENAEKYGVDPYLIAAVINVESGYRLEARSHKDARGLMQITPPTGQWIADTIGDEDYSQDKLYTADKNIQYGSWLLNNLSQQFNGDRTLVLAAYNGGIGNVKKWLKDDRYSKDGETLYYIPFKETENYIKKIDISYRVYSKLYKNFLR